MQRPMLSALCLFAASALGCPSKPSAHKDPPPEPPPSAAAVTPRASASAAPEAATIPTFVAEKFAPGDAKLDALYAVEGALAVSQGRRVGVIAGDGVTWAGEVPEGGPAYGPSIVTGVRGRWPDMLAAIYTTSQGRAPQPTYHPLSGKGGSFTVAEGGGWGDINGVARVGETVFLAVNSLATGVQVVPVRGPKLVRHLHTPAEAGCKEGEVFSTAFTKAPAITPRVLESSPAGTMVSLGMLCEKRGPAAEIWDKSDKSGKPTIVDLGRWWKTMSYRPTLLKGAGDELWAYSDSWSPVVLHYRDGAFEALPELGWPIDRIFVSPSGVLHAISDKVVHRFGEGKWSPFGRLPEAPVFDTIAVDDKGDLWGSSAGVHRLRPGPGALPPGPCTTHFVYLYASSWKNDKNYTYPATRKALSTFPEASSIGFVEFGDANARHVGVMVTSRAQAEALVAHVKATMKDESPRYFCMSPFNTRKIPLDAAN